jgi:pimeloyl-ACP methyl ester carboxylesterase
MATYVLMHGAWYGGWCWRKVTPLLRAAGHEVHAPTLTGLGERVHLAAPAVGLDTHVQDVLHVLEYEDLSGVVAVGHSYGGLVIAGVADRAPERLAHLVYLDADIREDGEAFVDGLPPARRAALEARVRTDGAGWRLPLDVDSALDGYGVDDPAERRWMAARLVPHPWKTATKTCPRVGPGRPIRRPRTASPPGRALRGTAARSCGSGGGLLVPAEDAQRPQRVPPAGPAVAVLERKVDRAGMRVL